MLSFPSDRRLLMQIVGGDRRPDVAKRNRQVAQGTACSAARRTRAVVALVQQLRQQRPQPRSWRGRCAAASSSPGSDRRVEVASLPADGLDARQQQQGAGSRPAEVPIYDAAQLLLSLGLPTSGAKELQKAVAKVPIDRQHGMVQHGSEVAAHLRSLRVGKKQPGRLLVRCPELFSWPGEERAAVLFRQLQWLGMTAAEAGKCFEQQPSAVGTPSYQPAIDVLAALYEAAGGKGSESGEQLLGRLLRGQPSAVNLPASNAKTLRERIVNLRRLRLSSAQIVAGLRKSWRLLDLSPKHLAGRQQLLHDELQVSPELGIDMGLFAKILYSAPRVVANSEETLVSRCRALVAVFGKDAVLKMMDASPDLLAIDCSVWQVALEVMRLEGVPDPVAVARRNAQILKRNWLDPRRLVNRLTLQRCLGLSPAAVYQHHAGYVAVTGSDRLAGRLLYLEQCGLLPLVEDKGPQLRAWRREHGLPAHRKAPGEPSLISLCDVCILNDDKFLCELQQNGCGSDFAGFQAVLQCLPAYQQLWAAANEEGARLRAALPDELQQRMAAGDDEEAAEEADD